MASSSSEDDVKKKGWLVVNTKGSIETSSDEEIIPNQASATEVSGSDVLAVTDKAVPLKELEPDSPTLPVCCGSLSSEGSTLVSGLPSPLPSNQNTLPLDSVEENLSSLANILKENIERDDSNSVDSFEVLSEGPDGSYSTDSQNEDVLEEEDEPQQQQLISDSDSDLVKLTEPSEMESAHSGIEEIDQDTISRSPQSQSPDLIGSSLKPTGANSSRPKNAPYEDVRSCPPEEEEADHVRIMSRRWPTEDGGFLLVQRFRKLEHDAVSTVSSMSDFSNFSMVGSRQRLLSDTQEESDDESRISDDCSFGSEETLPVNMTVRNVPPGIRQYLHRRNDVFNSKLTFFAILVLTAGLTLGIGHFVGSSQMVTHYQNVQEGQKLRLRSLQDELVSCMDKRKEISKLLQERERGMNHCQKEMEETPPESSSVKEEEEEENGLLYDQGIYDLRLCGHCQKGQLRYSKFCNTMCYTDSEEDHTWVATDIPNPTTDKSVDEFNDEEETVTLQREERSLPIIETTETRVENDWGYLDAMYLRSMSIWAYLEESHHTTDSKEGQNVVAYSDGSEQTHQPIDSEAGQEYVITDDDDDDDDDELEEDYNIFEGGEDFQGAHGDYSTNEHVNDNSGVLVGQVSNGDCADLPNSIERDEEPPNELGSIGGSCEGQTSTTTTVQDTEAKWICIDGSRDETCMEWSQLGDNDCLSQRRAEKSRIECEDKLEDPENDQKNKEDEVVHVSSLQQAFQSAWGIVENASKSFLDRDISLHNATEIMKDHAQDLKRVVETSWESIQSVAVQVNERHIQPIVSKVTQLVDRHMSAKRGRKGNKCRGRHCTARKQKQVIKQALRRKKSFKKEKHTAKGSHKKQNWKAAKKIASKGTKNGNIKKVTSSKAKVNRPIARATSESSEYKGVKTRHHQKSNQEKSTTVQEANLDEDNVILGQHKNHAEDIHAKQVYGRTKLPPKLNIEKLLDSLDMSCGGEIRCVENHKMDAVRLLKEMINYRQWLWEQRFRKDVDEVEDFMEELEEFIDEENVDDDDIEELKDEFEDMVEDIQKTTKKFFKNQENQSKQATDLANEKNKVHNRVKNIVEKKLKETEDGSVKIKQKRKGGAVVAQQENVVVADEKESIQRVTFSVEDLPSVQLTNSSFPSLSDSEEEETNDRKAKPSPGKDNPESSSYVNADQWFFRRAHDRELRRGSHQDSEWYFKRFRLWEQDRKLREQKDWYFQRVRSRENSRSCATQPLHCDWAKDESVVTVWEMYKWLTERFSIRADLRAWDLEDQINWFLRK